jgi:hypothetical protein
MEQAMLGGIRPTKAQLWIQSSLRALEKAITEAERAEELHCRATATRTATGNRPTARERLRLERLASALDDSVQRLSKYAAWLKEEALR